MTWPTVFSEPLDAPYRPERDDWLTRGAALRDLYDARAMARNGAVLPPNFDAVVNKLSAVVGCEPDGEAIRNATIAWTAERMR